MDVRLEVVHDKSRVSDVPLRRDTVVGRGKECQLRIPVADVSRRHCQFTLDGERLLIRDLGSSNGTQLADRTIPTGKDVLLSDGDSVTVGPVQFIVHITTTTDPSEVAPSADLEPTTDLDDTAEFPSFEEMAEEVTDYVIAPQEEASAPVPDTSLPPTPPSPGELPADNALEGEEPQNEEPGSVIDLELDSPIDAEAFDDIDSGIDSTDDIPTDTDPELASEHLVEPPAKSRSLFGLFRRRTRDDQEAEVSDDDLMEEPGEDPPIETVLADDGNVGSAHQAQLESVAFDHPPDTPIEDANDSVFDDDVPPDQLADTAAVFDENVSPVTDGIVNDDEAADVELVDDEDEHADDGNLMDFLGQFGD
tara:strand:+ start:972 stop:2063 length:1092 start_codon:yes stop_codon:yes gene_type:complete